MSGTSRRCLNRHLFSSDSGYLSGSNCLALFCALLPPSAEKVPKRAPKGVPKVIVKLCFCFVVWGGTFCSLRFQGTPAGYQSSKIHRQNENKSEKGRTQAQKSPQLFGNIGCILKKKHGVSVLFFRRFWAHFRHQSTRSNDPVPIVV